MKYFAVLLLLITNSCSLFSNDDGISCKNLVVTPENGPVTIEKRGDPTGQWIVTGIENPEIEERECNSGEECEVLIAEYNVKAAYPNPMEVGTSTNLIFSIPETTRVNIKIVGASYMEVPLNRVLPIGTHSLTIGFENGQEGCYKVEYFFGDSERANAYGMILVE